MYYIVQITQSNNFYAKSYNFPYSLYYLGVPVLFSFTQFSPLWVHLFYSVLLSFALLINISSLFPLLVLLSFPHLYSLADL
jgi:hypothetical protein